MAKEFYGDIFRWFIGVVEDNQDPLELGRVRVRVEGLHSNKLEDIDTEDLPWATVAISPDEPGVSGLHSTIQLQPGARVVGFFSDGSFSQVPIVTGILPQIEYASRNQQNNFTNSAYDRDINRRTTQGTGLTGRRNKIFPKSDRAFGAVGSTNAEIAYNFFISRGFTPQQAAGIVGNLIQESGVNLSTTIKSAGTERSYGIAQWNSAKAAGNRLGLLKEYASDLGRPWTDLEVQLMFIMYELENYPYLGLGALRAARTIEEATIAFETKYERPGIPHRSSRISYAKQVYNRYNSS